MSLILIILVVLLLCGGLGGPAIGFGTYGWGTTGPVGLIVLVLVLFLIFGNGRL